MNVQKNKIVLSAILLIGICAVAIAQNASGTPWSLNQCITYARSENLTVQKAQVNLSSAQVDVKTAQAKKIPSLSASISQGLTHSEPDGADGATGNSFIYSGNYNLSSSMTLYNGGRLNNSLRQSKVVAQASEFDVQTSENDIEISVTEAYLNILYSRESVKINTSTVETSKQQMERAAELLKAGYIAPSDYSQMESQYWSDKYSLVTAQNLLDRRILTLKQLLELDVDYDFQVDYPEIADASVLTPVPTSSYIYGKALQVMPEVKSSELGVESAKINEKIARSGSIPTISLSAGLGTGNNSVASDAFASQLSKNFSQNVGLSISIPIFNNRSAKSATEKAMLQTSSANISLQSTQKELLSTIETLYQEATGAQSRYAAATEKLRAAKTSYDLVCQQFEAGMKNTVELLQEKDNYLSAQLELSQAKYQAVLSVQLLNFYQNQPIKL
ncbi:MAG: TolC family protein [Flavobacteriales bacterium]|nr:TolC family protein [Flavobacteriales bacterium]